MYKLRLSRREKKKLLQSRWVIVAVAVLCVGSVVWLAWVRPLQKEAGVSSFDGCVKAGNAIQETYPEVCLTKDGKRFVNPAQQQAHKTSEVESEKLVPPSNPALLKLDIGEWNVRIPLTEGTFDLSYAYIENGEGDEVLFAYKRLINAGICKGDIGLTLIRQYLQHQPPYSLRNPAPIAQVGNAYFYVAYADKPCYDPGNAGQVAQVKQIAGDRSLPEFTATLLGGLKTIPAN